MTSLEKIALEKLESILYSIAKRCSDENKDRIQHEQIFIHDEINEAIQIVIAIEDNSKNN